MAKLRNSYATQASATALGDAVSAWLRDSDPSVLFRTCLTCHHNEKATSRCKRYDRVPPTDVIVGSTPCPKYDDAEDIPF